MTSWWGLLVTGLTAFPMPHVAPWEEPVPMPLVTPAETPPVPMPQVGAPWMRPQVPR